jgi:hypothetical protein
VDATGYAFVSGSPTGGSRAWHRVRIDRVRRRHPRALVTGVSCPSLKLCVAVDDPGDEIVSTDPRSRHARWRAHSVFGRVGALALSCPSASMCVAVGQGVVFSTPAPAEGLPWTEERPPEFGSGSTGAVACRSASMCVANDLGQTPVGIGATLLVAVPSPAPPAGQLRHLLRSWLGARGQAAGLLRRGGYRRVLNAPSAGTLTITWTLARAGRVLTLARGSLRFTIAGTAQITVRLTAAGRSVLAAGSPIDVLARGVFRPAGARALSASRRLTV